MLIEMLSFGLLGVVAYRAYGGQATAQGISGELDSRIANGYQYRDITYTTGVDLKHPDVINNQFAGTALITSDRGVNGIQRAYAQQYPECSEINHLYRTDNLFL